MARRLNWERVNRERRMHENGLEHADSELDQLGRPRPRKSEQVLHAKQARNTKAGVAGTLAKPKKSRDASKPRPSVTNAQSRGTSSAGPSSDSRGTSSLTRSSKNTRASKTRSKGTAAATAVRAEAPTRTSVEQLVAMLEENILRPRRR